MARPRKEINKEQFEKLCAMQCTESELCSWFDITDKTLDNWCKRTYHKSFSEVYAQKREGGKISLRRMQWHLAEKNAAMAIFLGKNMLGQTDTMKVESKSDGKLAELIDSLKEPYDVHREAETLISDMADESAKEN